LWVWFNGLSTFEVLPTPLSCTELGRLLNEKGLCGVTEAVVDNDVCGESLLELTESEI